MTATSTQDPAANSKFFDFVMRSTADGVISADANGVMVQVNPAGAAMLGMTPEEILGRRPQVVFRNNPALVNLFTRQGEQSLDVRLPRRRLASGIAATLEGGLRVVLLHDVTEKRDLETRREALVKAISHDLRNPISAITGYADLVEKFGELSESQSRFITRIRQTTTKLYEVTASLVDLAWIEAGMPLEHRAIQLHEVINSAVTRAGMLAHDKQIVIAVSMQKPLPAVMGDRDRLEQAVYNLLHNAITYSDREQTVAIHSWSDDSDVYCSVADRGIGIADDEIELVFDRLYRSRDELVRNTTGGGLGLTAAKTIIDRHGGAIWASSNLGEGSTFTFLLPTVKV